MELEDGGTFILHDHPSRWRRWIAGRLYALANTIAPATVDELEVMADGTFRTLFGDGAVNFSSSAPDAVHRVDAETSASQSPSPCAGTSNPRRDGEPR